MNKTGVLKFLINTIIFVVSLIIFLSLIFGLFFRTCEKRADPIASFNRFSNKVNEIFAKTYTQETTGSLLYLEDDSGVFLFPSKSNEIKVVRKDTGKLVFSLSRPKDICSNKACVCLCTKLNREKAKDTNKDPKKQIHCELLTCHKLIVEKDFKDTMIIADGMTLNPYEDNIKAIGNWNAFVTDDQLNKYPYIALNFKDYLDASSDDQSAFLLKAYKNFWSNLETKGGLAILRFEGVGIDEKGDYKILETAPKPGLFGPSEGVLTHETNQIATFLSLTRKDILLYVKQHISEGNLTSKKISFTAANSLTAAEIY